MIFRDFAFAVGVVLALSSCALSSPSVSRKAGENDTTFASRALNLSKVSEPHVTATKWNGLATIFVDYQTLGEYPERPVVALQQNSSGTYRKLDVTLGEQEGGMPNISVIGFANADKDLADELVIILAWNVLHYDVGGMMYEVRIFDDPNKDQRALTQLDMEKHFDVECDCDWRDGKTETAAYKTLASVQTKLKKLGY